MTNKLPTTKPCIGIIVLNWNCAQDSIACANSLLAQSYQNIRIIFVDNASSDDSPVILEKFAKQHRRADLIVNKKNLGFANGINTGIKNLLREGVEYIALLNPDAKAHKEWLQSLYSELVKDPKTGITTGCMVKKGADAIDSTGEIYTTWGLPGPRNRDEPIANAPKESGEVFGATGGGVLYRTEMLKEIGLFDEDFFMYYEDVDISFRAQLSGWRVRYSPHAIAYHKVGASSKKVPGLAVYHTFKNLPLVFIKNMPGCLFWSIGIRFFTTYWLIFISAIRHGNGWPALKGIAASLLLQPRAYMKRLRIQKSRRVSVEYVKSIVHKGPLPNQTGLLKFRKLLTGK